MQAILGARISSAGEHRLRPGRLNSSHAARPSSKVGYSQSEKHFNKDVEGTIRQELDIKPATDSANLDMADQSRHSSAATLHAHVLGEPCAEGVNNAAIGYYTGTKNIV